MIANHDVFFYLSWFYLLNLTNCNNDDFRKYLLRIQSYFH